MDLGSASGQIRLLYDGAGAAAARKDLASLESAGVNFAKGFDAAGKTMLGIGAAIGAPIGLATKEALDFGREMANVNSILQLSDQGIADLGDQVQAMASEVNKAPAELAAGLYDIASSGFTGADGLLVLEAAAKAATAGLTTTATSGRAISSVLNAYGLEASEAQNVSDVLFQTVQDGVLTFDQLANNMGNTLPIAAALGVPIEQLAAGYAQLTLQGQNASAAETNLASLMRAAINPTDDLTAAVNAYGFESTEALIAAEGFPGLLKAIDQGAGGSKEALFDMLGSQEALNAALVLSKDDAAAYIDELGNMEGASEDAGATQEALAKQMQSGAFAIERAQVAISTALTAIGEGLAEGPVKVAANAVGDLAFAFADLSPQVHQFVGLFGGVSAGLLLAGGGAALAAGKILELGEAFGKAGLSLGKFALGLGVAGALIGTGILAYQTNFLGFGDAVDGAMATAGKAVDTFAKRFGAAFSNAQGRGLNSVAAGVRAFGRALDAAIGTDVSDQFDRIGETVQALDDAFWAANDAGSNFLTSTLFGLGAAADELGFTQLGDSLRDLGFATQQFGEEFRRAQAITGEQRYSELAADVDAFALALDKAFGVNLTGPLGELSDALDAFALSADNARAGGLSEIEANLIGLRDAVGSLLNLDLNTFFDDLGSNLGGLADGVREVGSQIVAGDFAGALDTFTQGLQDLGEFVATIDLSGVLSAVGDAFTSLGTEIESLIAGINWGDVGAALGESLTAAINAAGFVLGSVAAFLTKVDAAIADAFSFDAAKYPAIETAGREFGANIGKALGEAISAGFGGDGAAAIDDATAHIDMISGGGEAVETGNIVEAAFKFADAAAQQVAAEVARAFGQENLATILEAQDPWGAFWDAVGTWIQEGLATVNIPVPDISAVSAAIQETIQSISDAIMEAFNAFSPDSMGGPGERGEAGTTSAGFGSMFTEWANGVIDGLTAGFTSAVEQIKAGLEAKKTDFKNMLGDTIGGFFAFVFGVQDVQAEESGILPSDTDPEQLGRELGTQFAETFKSEGFAAGLEEGLATVEPGVFSGAATALLGKIGEAMSLALAGAAPTGPQPAAETGVGATGLSIAQSLITGLATSLADSITAAPPESFSAVGQALAAKVSEALAFSFDDVPDAMPGDTGGPVGLIDGGGIGGSLVAGLATSIAASITAAPPESFAAVGQAISAKISEVMATAMGAGASFAGEGGPRDAGPSAGGGIGQAIAQMIAAQVQGADFAAVGTALQTALVTPIQTAMAAATLAVTNAGSQMSAEFLRMGTSAATAGTSISTSFTSAITQGMSAAILAVTNAGSQIVAEFDRIVVAASTAGQGAGQAFTDGLTSGMAGAVAAVQSATVQIHGYMENAAGGAYSAGVAVGEGFANGIRSQIGNVSAAAGELAGAALGAIGGAIVEGSPSKVTTEMGVNTGLGLAVGIEEATPEAAASGAALGSTTVQAIAAAVLEQLSAIIPDLSSAFADAFGVATEAGAGAIADEGDATAAAATEAGAEAGSSFGQSMVGAMLGQIDLGGDGIGGQAIQSILGQLGGATAAVAETGRTIGQSLGEGVNAGLAGAIDPLSMIPEGAGREMAERLFADLKSRQAAYVPQVESLLSERNRHAADLQERGQPIHLTIQTVLDGEVIDERIEEVTAGGMRQSLGRNPGLRRRR